MNCRQRLNNVALRNYDVMGMIVGRVMYKGGLRVVLMWPRRMSLMQVGEGRMGKELEVGEWESREGEGMEGVGNGRV